MSNTNRTRGHFSTLGLGSRAAGASSRALSRVRNWVLAETAGSTTPSIAVCELLERRELLAVDFGVGLWEMRAPDAEYQDGLGTSVALSAFRVFSGAPQDDTGGGTDSGAVRIGNLIPGEYAGGVTAVGVEPYDGFGRAVATGYSEPLGTEIFIVGAPNESNFGTTPYQSGSAYISRSDNLAHVQHILNPEPTSYGHFGESVALNYHYALIGAPGNWHQNINSGEAVLYSTITGQITKLQPPSPVRRMEFGASVAMTQSETLGFSIAIVGAPNASYGGFNSGSVYLFNADTGAFLSRIESPDAAAGEHFGASLAASGETLIVGCPDDEGKGAAYIYNIVSGAFTKVVPTQRQAAERFGHSVAMEYDYAVIGAPDRDFGAGSAFLYRVSTGQIVSQFTSLTPAPYDNFGYSVAIRGASIAIGEPGDQGESGSVFVTRRPSLSVELVNDSGQSLGQNAQVQEGRDAHFLINRSSLFNLPLRAYYTLSGTAEAPDYGSGVVASGYVDFAPGQTELLLNVPLTSDYRFDGETRLRADTLTISLDTDPTIAGQQGNPTGDLIRDEQGRWVERPGGTGAQLGYEVVASQWEATVTILDETADPGFGSDRAVVSQLAYHAYNYQFGYSVDAVGSTVAMGSPYSGSDQTGSVMLRDGGAAGGQIEFAAPNPSYRGYFGFSVGIDRADGVSEDVVVGEPNRNTNGFIGAVHFYRTTRISGLLQSAVHQRTVLAPRGTDLESFGHAVAVHNRWAAIGAQGDDTLGQNAGGAYLYDIVGNNLIPLVDPSTVAGDQFGWDVAISDQYVLVGNGHGNAPSVSVFDARTGAFIRRITNNGGGFGYSVAIDGTTAVVGAFQEGGPGAAYVYDLSNVGTQVPPPVRLTAQEWDRRQYSWDSDLRDYFGYSVSIASGTVLVGAPLDSETGVFVGAAYLFDATTSVMLDRLTVQPGAAYFGFATALTPSTVVVGAPLTDDGPIGDSGAVFTWGPRTLSVELVGPNNSGVQTLTRPEAEFSTATFRFTRSPGLPTPLTVHYSISGEVDGGDAALNDLAQGYVEFGPNQTVVEITIPITVDNRADTETPARHERLIISLDVDPIESGQQGNPAGDLIRDGLGRLIPRPDSDGTTPVYAVDPMRWQATLEIIDVDSTFVYIYSEDNLGSELSGDAMSFRVRREGVTSAAAQITLDVSGTMTRSTDYLLNVSNGGTLVGAGRTVTLTIPANVSEVTVVVSPVDDALPEGVEWFHAELELPPGSGYTLPGDASLRKFRGTFIDADVGSVYLEGMEFEAEEAGQTAAHFQLNRGGIAFNNTPMLVNFRVTAVDNPNDTSDFVVLDGPNGTQLVPNGAGIYSVLLPVGTDAATIYVRAVDDEFAESNQRIWARLASGNDYRSHPVLNEADLVIVDNDRPLLRIDATDPFASETSRNSGAFTITRVGGVLSTSFTAYYGITGTAAWGIDYDGIPQSVTFGPGVLTQTILIQPKQEHPGNIAEPTETVALTLLPGGMVDIVTGFTSATVEITDLTVNAGTLAKFDWSMPPRYGMDTDNDGVIDVIPNTPEYANPAGFDVIFDSAGTTSGSGALTYDWRIYDATGVQVDHAAQPSFRVALPEATYTVRLRVTDAAGVWSEESQIVEVDDILIVSMGDSYASGEGAPDYPRDNDPTRWFDYDNELAGWARGGNLAQTLEHAAAHRSSFAASSLTAKWVEDNDPKTSVTFVFVAQSGATLVNGVLLPKQEGRDGAGAFADSQITRVQQLVGGRTIDSLMLSIGGNDVGFADILKTLVERTHITYRPFRLFGPSLFIAPTSSLASIGHEIQAGLETFSSMLPGFAAVLSNTPGINISRPGNVLYQSYPDLGGNDAGDAGELLGDVLTGSAGVVARTFSTRGLNVLGLLTGFGVDLPLRVDAEEYQFVRDVGLYPLQDLIAGFAESTGWTSVAAPDEFRYHGYSSSDPWIRTGPESRRLLGWAGDDGYLSPAGAVHPNYEGQRRLSYAHRATYLGASRPDVSLNSAFAVPEGQTLTVGATILAGQDLTWEWDLNFDGTFNATATGPSAVISAGTFPAASRIAVRVTDRLGRSDYAIADVQTVNSSGGGGRYVNEVQRVSLREPFRIELRREAPDAEPVRAWRILWGDEPQGHPGTIIPPEWGTVSHVYQQTGQYNYKIWFTDAEGEYEVVAPLERPNSVIVVDSEPFPEVSVSVSRTEVVEGEAEGFAFVFTRDGLNTRPVSISLSVQGTATNGVDFAFASGFAMPRSVYFAAGVTSRTITLYAPADSDEAEGVETLTVEILLSSMYSIATGSASVTIQDGASTLRGSVAGVVFDDLNGNAVRDPGELGVENAQVGLDLDGDGLFTGPGEVINTSATGEYVFAGLLPGSYATQVFDVAGRVLTGARARSVQVAPSASVTGQNFGVAVPVVVRGSVFLDDDADGVHDVGEPARVGAFVWVDRNASGAWDVDEPSAVANSLGEYELVGIPPGELLIRARTTNEVGEPVWTSTTGGSDGALAITAFGGAVVEAAVLGQRPLRPAIGSLVSNQPTIVSGGSMTLTADGLSAWASLTRFFRESNGIPGLQTDTPNHANDDAAIGVDENAGDGWAITLDVSLLEGQYAFYARAESDAGDVSLVPAEVFVTVTGQPDPTVVGVRRLNTIVREGGGLGAAYEVFRTGFNSDAITVNLAIASGPGFAENGIDFEQIASTLTIGAGQSSALIVIPLPDDGVTEAMELLRIEVLPGSGYAVGALAQAEVSVRDASSTPDVVSVVSAGVENSGGPTIIRISLDDTVSSTLTVEDVGLVNLTTGRVYAAAEIVVFYEAVSGVIELYVPTEGGNTGVLPDGQYRLTINGAGVTNGIGHLLDGNGNGVGGDDFIFSFFVGAAGVSTWDGDAGTTDWSDPINWTGDTLPGSTSSVEIPAGFVVNLGQSSVTVGSITVSGTLGINGATLQVVGSLTITGLVAVNGSSLIVGGSIENGGVLVLSPTSAVTAGGDYTQTASGVLTTEVGAGGLSATLVAAGTITLDGLLNVVQVDGFDPIYGFPGVEIVSVRGSARIGDFAAYSLATTAVGSYSYHAFGDRIQIIWNFADFTGDGGVDGDDVIAFMTLWDESGGFADVNGDGGVDGDDLIAFFELWDRGGR